MTNYSKRFVLPNQKHPHLYSLSTHLLCPKMQFVQILKVHSFLILGADFTSLVIIVTPVQLLLSQHILNCSFFIFIDEMICKI